MSTELVAYRPFNFRETFDYFRQAYSVLRAANSGLAAQGSRLAQKGVLGFAYVRIATLFDVIYAGKDLYQTAHLFPKAKNRQERVLLGLQASASVGAFAEAGAVLGNIIVATHAVSKMDAVYEVTTPLFVAAVALQALALPLLACSLKESFRWRKVNNLKEEIAKTSPVKSLFIPLDSDHIELINKIDSLSTKDIDHYLKTKSATQGMLATMLLVQLVGVVLLMNQFFGLPHHLTASGWYVICGSYTGILAVRVTGYYNSRALTKKLNALVDSKNQVELPSRWMPLVMIVATVTTVAMVVLWRNGLVGSGAMGYTFLTVGTAAPLSSAIVGLALSKRKKHKAL